ncbi:MAG: alpha/beta fold hydrolase [Acidobacteriota bacterium]
MLPAYPLGEKYSFIKKRGLYLFDLFDAPLFVSNAHGIVIFLHLAPGGDVLANAKRMGATPAQLAALESEAEADNDEAFGELVRTEWPLYFHAYLPAYARLLDDVVYSVQGQPPAAETAAYDVTARLGEITAPTLVLAGRSDFVCPPSQAETLARGIPGAELRVFEKSGHMPFVEEPEATFTAVRDWFARHR